MHGKKHYCQCILLVQLSCFCCGMVAADTGYMGWLCRNLPVLELEMPSQPCTCWKLREARWTEANVPYPKSKQNRKAKQVPVQLARRPAAVRRTARARRIVGLALSSTMALRFSLAHLAFGSFG